MVPVDTLCDFGRTNREHILNSETGFGTTSAAGQHRGTLRESPPTTMAVEIHGHGIMSDLRVRHLPQMLLEKRLEIPEAFKAEGGRKSCNRGR